MIGGLGMSAMVLAAAGALAMAGPPEAAMPAGSDTEARGEALGRMIEGRLRADGPFFTDRERAVIEQACGYAPGEWDGFDLNMQDNVLHCANGNVASGAEVEAVLAAALPRIEARVQAIMQSAEVTEAIARITEQATAEAMQRVHLAMANLDEALDGLDNLDIDVDADPGDGVDVDVDVDVDDDPDADEDGDPDTDDD